MRVCSRLRPSFLGCRRCSRFLHAWLHQAFARQVCARQGALLRDIPLDGQAQGPKGCGASGNRLSTSEKLLIRYARACSSICCAGGQALALLLSPEGTFVRDILLDELAKGLDAAWRIAADQGSTTVQRTLTDIMGVRPIP